MCENSKKVIPGSSRVGRMSKFCDMDLVKNIVAGLIAGVIVSGAAYAYLKTVVNKALPGVQQIAERLSESALSIGETIYKSQVVETPDGTKFYRYTHAGKNYNVIEDKDGRITLTFAGPFL